MSHFDYIVNYDDMIQDKVKYRNYSKLTLQWPFRAIFYGQSGSSKTNTLFQLLFTEKCMLDFDEVYLYAQCLDEDKYRYMTNKFEMIEAKLTKMAKKPIKLFYSSDKLDEVIHPKDLDDQLQKLIIFDDFVTAKNQEVILEYFTYSRKYNCSVIYISQDWTMIPKTIRGNSSYALIFRVNNSSDLHRIYNDIVKGRTKEEFLKMYEDALKENYYGFITIDNKTTDAKRSLRIGLL